MALVDKEAELNTVSHSLQASEEDGNAYFQGLEEAVIQDGQAKLEELELQEHQLREVAAENT